MHGFAAVRENGAGRILLLAGATATGKSALAIEAAHRLGGEVVSVDATAVYRGLDIGSAKPGRGERRAVAHHMIDVADPWENYTLGRFLPAARAAIGRIRLHGRAVVLVGGTGLYARALVEGWRPAPAPDGAVRDELRRRLLREGSEALWRELGRRAPERAARIHPNDRTRVLRALETLVGANEGNGDDGGGVDAALSLVGTVEAYVLDVGRSALERRIGARARAHFAGGLAQETLDLLRRGVPPDRGALRSIGYRSAVAWATGRLGLEEAERETVRQTLSLAKRQRTWWRSVPWARWVDPEELARTLGVETSGGP